MISSRGETEALPGPPKTSMIRQLIQAIKSNRGGQRPSLRSSQIWVSESSQSGDRKGEGEAWLQIAKIHLGKGPGGAGGAHEEGSKRLTVGISRETKRFLF